MKGCGEAGTVGALAAVTNAALDALWEAGVRHVDMPLTPLRVWGWLQAARASPRNRGSRDRLGKSTGGWYSFGLFEDEIMKTLLALLGVIFTCALIAGAMPPQASAQSCNPAVQQCG